MRQSIAAILILSYLCDWEAQQMYNEFKANILSYLCDWEEKITLYIIKHKILSYLCDWEG